LNAPFEKSCAGAVVFALMAASSALTFSDRVAFISSVRDGPLAPFEWIAAGVMVFYLFLAGGFSGAALLLWSQSRQAGQQSSRSSQ
jgi:hypothetical protein